MSSPSPGAPRPPHPPVRGPATAAWPLLPLLVYAAALVVAGLAIWLAGDHERSLAPGGDGQELATGGDVADVPAEEQAPEPTGVRIPSLGAELDTRPLGLDDEGRLEVPGDPRLTGWWTGGARPGERGPAVVVGHVDSRDGPGAFYDLDDLPVGERVSIDRADGTAVHFRVERVEQHPKDDFPTAAVYGETDAPTLRLVTCGGEFDAGAGSYRDNVVVFLELEGWTEAS